MDAGRPRPTKGLREEELLEAVHLLGKELSRRGETLAASWSEETCRELASGGLTGFILPDAAGAPSIGFYSLRPRRAYAHVHVPDGPGAETRALALLHALVGSLPSAIGRADIGLSGLSDDREGAIARRAVRELGGTLLERRALERSLGSVDDETPPSPIDGARSVPTRSIPIDSLAELDWRSFRGTPDEQLVADSLEEDRRGLLDLLAGRLGRFLDEASEAFVTSEGVLVGATLVAEQTPQRAIVLDLVVDPSWRRRGVGRFLLRRVFRGLRALGFSSVRLWVTESNRPADLLYVSMDFREVGTARIYRWRRTPDPSAPQSS